MVDRQHTVLWDVSNPEEPEELATVPEPGHVNAMAFSPTGSRLATANDEGEVRLWDIRNRDRGPGTLGAPLRGHGGAPVYALAFHPNGRVLASGGADHKTVLWNVARPTRVEQIDLPPQKNVIFDLAFSPDGKLLAAADGSSAVVLWDVGTRRQLGRDLRVSASSGENPVDSLDFDESGRFLVSAGRKNPIVVWSSVLWSDEYKILRRYACRIARRNLTASEWRALFRDTELESRRRQTCPEWPLED